MTFEDDARSLESAVARFISALLLRVIHLLELPAVVSKTRELGEQPCAKHPTRAAAKAPDLEAARSGAAPGG